MQPPRPIRDRKEPSAFAQAVIILAIVIGGFSFACIVSALVAVKIWGS